MLTPTDIEREKAQLISNLESNFRSKSLDRIVQINDTFGEYLTNYICNSFLTNCAKLISGVKNVRMQDATFLCGAEAYKVYHSVQDMAYSDSVIFHIVPRPYEELHEWGKQEIRIPLSNGGRYANVIFTFYSPLNVHRQELDRFFDHLYATGNKWMSEQIVKAFRTAIEKMSVDLYEYVRVVTAIDERLMNGFLFSSLSSGKDFVILDDQAIEAAMSVISSQSRKYGRDPNEMLLQLVREVVPSDDSIIQLVEKGSGAPFDFSLNYDSAQYYKEDQDFFETLRAVWGDGVTCFPILSDENIVVVAFYPSTSAPGINPILEYHRDELAKRARRSVGRIRRHLALLKRVTSITRPDQAGSFFGGMAAGFLRQMTDGG